MWRILQLVHDDPSPEKRTYRILIEWVFHSWEDANKFRERLRAPLSLSHDYLIAMFPLE
jgi:hypothetical protein